MRLFTTALCLLALDFVRAAEPICTDAEDYNYSDGSTKRGNALQASHSLISQLGIHAPLTTLDLIPSNNMGGNPWLDSGMGSSGMVSVGIRLADYPNVIKEEQVAIEELVAGIHALVTTCTSGTIALGTGAWEVSLDAFNEGTGQAPPARRHSHSQSGAGIDVVDREGRSAAPGRRAATTNWDSFNVINGEFEVLSLSLPVISTVFGHRLRPWDEAVETPMLDDGVDELLSLMKAGQDTDNLLQWTSETSGANWDISLRPVGIDTWGTILGDETAAKDVLSQMATQVGEDLARRSTTRGLYQLNLQDDQGMVMDATRTLTEEDDPSGRCEPKPGLFVPPLEDEDGSFDDGSGVLLPVKGPWSNITARSHQLQKRARSYQTCAVRYTEHDYPSTCMVSSLPCDGTANANKADNVLGPNNKWGDYQFLGPIRNSQFSTYCDFEWRLTFPNRLDSAPGQKDNEYQTEHVYELGLFHYFLKQVNRVIGCGDMDTQLTPPILRGQEPVPIRAIENCLPSGATPNLLFIISRNVNNAKNKLFFPDAEDFWGPSLPSYDTNGKRSLYVAASVSSYLGEETVKAAFGETHGCIRDVLQELDRAWAARGQTTTWATRYMDWINVYMEARSNKLFDFYQERLGQARAACSGDQNCLDDIDAMVDRNWSPNDFVLDSYYYNLT